jgi:hypothetical protein
MTAEIDRLSSLPLPRLAAEVMTRGSDQVRRVRPAGQARVAARHGSSSQSLRSSLCTSVVALSPHD